MTSTLSLLSKLEVALHAFVDIECLIDGILDKTRDGKLEPTAELPTFFCLTTLRCISQR